MNRILRALLAMLLLVTAPFLCFGGTQPPAVEGRSSSAQQWTRYDWNAASGKSGPARFEIEQGNDGVLLRIIAATPNDARFVHEVTVEPQTLYRITCRVRSQDVVSGARGAGISVIDILEGSPDIKGSSNEWQMLEFYGKTGPDQRKLSVTVGIGGYGSLNSGTAWFRDVTVAKIGNAPAGIPIASLQPPTVTTPVSAGRSGKGGAVIAVLGFFGVLLAVWGIITGIGAGIQTEELRMSLSRLLRRGRGSRMATLP